LGVFLWLNISEEFKLILVKEYQEGKLDYKQLESEYYNCKKEWQ